MEREGEREREGGREGGRKNTTNYTAITTNTLAVIESAT